MSVNTAYRQAAISGLYEKSTGLRGKYDNVRRFWEDELTRRYIKPYFKKLCGRRVACKGKIRILDLGCGCGDGYELVEGFRKDDLVPRRAAADKLLGGSLLESYVGVDINHELLEKAKLLYGNNSKAIFFHGDFLRDLDLKRYPSFDIYMANYGTMSHCNDEECVELLARIANHGQKGSLILADWLGGNAYAWQNYWQKEPQDKQVIDYVISYIYEKEERQKLNLNSFPMRLMTPATIAALVKKASIQSDVHIKVRQIYDRSIFIGRHIETGEYNDHPQPLRRAVNSLWQPGVRTDLKELYVCYRPQKGFDTLNKQFTIMESAWNGLVKSAEQILSGSNPVISPELKKNAPFMRQSAKKMANLFKQVQHLPSCDPRANIFEPQFAWVLCNVEALLQRGKGMGHGLMAVCEIN